MSTRIYLPLTSTGLAALVAEARIDGPLQAHAVTEALAEEWPEGDQEEWEYAALAAAADTSWTLRTSADTPRRHVLAVDVADDAVTPAASDDVTAVNLSHEVVWKNIGALHMDTEDLAGAPTQDGYDPELAWFATQEIADLS
ncbi:hypothetical protein BJ980_003252 [Nocardioides daedukensis]|uniref:Uncharacterized protein n=1 Tax=Nocardioides daedukensis TaxID=634462 RepID=A0A7Y9UU96_9ACTN|nr:hypothetical protein [Nocardioides daedukensis]NYG60329.1 hypothetical protein [Nocardioides daedukensis]